MSSGARLSSAVTVPQSGQHSCPTQDGFTLLHHAIHYGLEDVVGRPRHCPVHCHTEPSMTCGAELWVGAIEAKAILSRPDFKKVLCFDAKSPLPSLWLAPGLGQNDGRMFDLQSFSSMLMPGPLVDHHRRYSRAHAAEWLR